MNNHYYNAEDLNKFGNIGEFQKGLADRFFSYYGEVFSEGALSAREKSLSHWRLPMLYNVLIALMHIVAMLLKKDGVNRK
jgi:hypothetical protein